MGGVRENRQGRPENQHEALMLMSAVCGIAARESMSAIDRGEKVVASELFRGAVDALAGSREQLESLSALFKLAYEVAQSRLDEQMHDSTSQA
jgi:hypothetical protein